MSSTARRFFAGVLVVLAMVGMTAQSASAADNVLVGKIETSRRGDDVTLRFVGFGAGPRHVAVTFLEGKNTAVLRDEFDQVVASAAPGSDSFTKTYRLPTRSSARGFAVVTGPEAPKVLGTTFERATPAESDVDVPWLPIAAAVGGAALVLALLHRRRRTTSTT